MYRTLTNHQSEYIQELQDDKAEAILEVQLVDGSYIYGDDNNKAFEEPSFWKRLQKENPPIERIFIRFRTERVEPFSAYEKPEGFFFVKSCVKYAGSQNTLYFYNLGIVREDGKLLVRTYRVPDLLFIGETERSLRESESLIIWT